MFRGDVLTNLEAPEFNEAHCNCRGCRMLICGPGLEKSLNFRHPKMLKGSVTKKLSEQLIIATAVDTSLVLTCRPIGLPFMTLRFLPLIFFLRRVERKKFIIVGYRVSCQMLQFRSITLCRN